MLIFRFHLTHPTPFSPQRQFKSMFDEKRKMTSICYMVSLGSSIVVCFLPIPTGPRIGLLVLLLLVQVNGLCFPMAFSVSSP